MYRSLVALAVLILAAHSDTAVGQSDAQPFTRTTRGENVLARTDRGNASTDPDLLESTRLYKEAAKYGNAGLFRQAAELFERAIKLNPEFADAYFGLGHAYFDLKQWAKAIEPLQRAIELKPNDNEARDLLDQARLMLQGERSSPPNPVAAKPESEPVAGTVVSLGAGPQPEVLTTKIKSNEMELTKLYRIGPGDVLDVRFEDPTPSAKSTLFTVTPSGLLELPNLTEPLAVAGLTVDEISARLEEDLKRQAISNNPKVLIGVRDYVSHTILVSGLVKEAGTKILRREAIPLYVVVADAQPLPEAARVSLVRNETSEMYDIDLTQPAEMNLLVHPGDVITLLANQTQFFYVGGEVKAPGEKTFRRGLTLTQAIIAAGGLTKKSGEARLARDNGKGFLVVSRYKLKDIESGKIADPLVQPGDRITILD